ncbi:LuxR C-terminal-related transcriptional regulator [Actinoplanes sp. NPDC023714]|uniref:LuxR C-terminal-related transcriptional regulator n=1 Tax=Actinoplanes sp. NPDC023714 TaxID=3154322 RepID=UPI0033EAF434
MALPELAAELSAIGGSALSPGDRADAVLDLLQRVYSFDAGFVGLFDPRVHRQVSLTSRGHTARVRHYHESPQLIDDFARVALLRPHHPPVQVNDRMPAVDAMRGWREIMRPEGFRSAIGLVLTTADGRYLGNIGLQSTGGKGPGEEQVRLLHQVSRLIADILDPLRAVAAVAALVAHARAGVGLTHAATTVPVPGLPGDALLAEGSAVLRVTAERLRGGPQLFTFLTGDPGGGLVRVTALACPPQPASDLHAVVVLSPPPDQHGLTMRELEVLGLLVDGCSNTEIAVALRMAPRTAVAHLEHIMIKLAAPSRTFAAVQALRRGLFIPAELTLGRQRAAVP